MSKIHLISNAHIDPIWQWQWEEGAAEAISTFRVAADFCEQYDGFVFNHNEVILYRWIEEMEPALFKRIQRLVKEGKWHIMGGWYLQPDCNMPSGESFIRQILHGKTYFKEKFGAEPTTAINFDPFGHTRGLVQILKKTGYDSYLFCRPLKEGRGMVNPLENETFIWVGFDGSRILAHRAFDSYASGKGHAVKKLKNYLEEHGTEPIGALLWGIGNHGGGPSREDLENFNEFMKENEEHHIIHSSPEAYFKDIQESGGSLPEYKKDLNPWAVGCYTTQVQIKQGHRLLENELYKTEKMVSHASITTQMPYPAAELDEAARALLLVQFHDILPGTSVQPSMEEALHTIGHGMELLSQCRAKAMFALMAGQEKVCGENIIPVMAYNPHPFPIKGIFECEFHLGYRVKLGGMNANPRLYCGQSEVPAQFGKVDANSFNDNRKRIIFFADLAPMQITRFDCAFDLQPKEPAEPVHSLQNDNITFNNGTIEAVVNAKTGLLDMYRVNGVDCLKENAFLPLVIEDDDHSIGTYVKNFRDVIGKFTLMSPERGTAFSSVTGVTLPSVRVIEDGMVRMGVESVMEYGDSALCIQYYFPKKGSEVEVRVRVHWNEKSKMLKMSIPTVWPQASYRGQTAFGIADLFENGDETVSQKWVAALSNDLALTLINEGTYGSDFCDGEIRISMLRSTRYGCLTPANKRTELYNGGYVPRIDQGERMFVFYLNAGPKEDRMVNIDREALIHNEKPFLLSFFASGDGCKPKPLAICEDAAVQISAIKKAQQGDGYILRLFEPTGQDRSFRLHLPALDMVQNITLKGFEVKTLRIIPETKAIIETDMLERSL